MQLSASYKQIWQLAYPLMLGTLAQNVTNIINTAFMARVSEVSLGAAAIGGVFYFSLTMVAFGLSMGSQILIARKAGEGNSKAIGNIFDQNLYLFAILGIILFAFLYGGSPFILKHLLKSDDIYKESIDFLNYRTFGLFFTLGTIAFRGFYTGIGKTKAISTGILIMSVINIILDYVLIFGKLGLPAMGIKGAGLASGIAELIALLYYVYIIFKHNMGEQYNVFKFNKPNKFELIAISNHSLPLVVQHVISLGAWFMFFVAIERVGEHELAISNVLRSLYMLLMTPIWGYFSAINTLVSNLIGQNKREEIVNALKMGIYISIVSAFITILGNIFIPNLVLSVFTSDIHIIQDAISSLHIISASMLLFATAAIVLSCVSGVGDTKAALVIEILSISCYSLYLIYVCIINPQALWIIWMAEFVYWTILGALSYYRLRTKSHIL